MNKRRHADQPKDYSLTLIVMAVSGFMAITLAMEFFK